MILNVLVGVVHFFASVFLIVFILLHSGRGSGLSDMFGGSAAGGAMAGGTVVERNLDRMTIVAALIFTFTSVFLGLRLSVGTPAPIADTTVTAPTGEVPTGEVPTGEVPTGEVPTGEVPTGEVPTGDVPTDTSASEPAPAQPPG